MQHSVWLYKIKVQDPKRKNNNNNSFSTYTEYKSKQQES